MPLKQPLFLAVPTYDTPIVINEKTSSVWYRFWIGLYQEQPTQAEITVTVGPSPFTYTAPVGGNALISGGTISAIALTRTRTNNLGPGENVVPLSNGDQLTITYSVKPTLVFMPR